MLGRTNLLVTITGVCIMNHPVLLASTLTDDEFNHLYNLANFPKCLTKNISYFWILTDLSIGCSNLQAHHDFSNCTIASAEEFLQYIEQQKLLRTLE